MNFLWMLLDIVLLPFVYISGWILWAFRRVGAARLALGRAALLSIGVFPVRDHYYEPRVRFDRDYWSKPRELDSIDLRVSDQLDFLRGLNFSPELLELSWAKPAANLTDFSLSNQSFRAGDADFLYQFIRFIKPRQFFEIGSGNSTKVAHIAIRKNQQDGAGPCNHVCVEPFEMPWLERLGVRVIRERLESMDLSLFEGLESGDVLFIDSSHIIRPGGEVLVEYLRLLPKLKSGVYIHIHDIFSPRDYLRHWLEKDVRFWNEQYLVEGILANSPRYEVVAALNMLKHEYFDSLRSVCPYLKGDSEPGSLYLRVR